MSDFGNIEFKVTNRSNTKVVIELLDLDKKELAGTGEGYINDRGDLITVIHIYDPYQKKGLGSKLFDNIFNSLAEIRPIKSVIGGWHSGEEFGHYKNGMSTNLLVFQRNCETMSPEEAAFFTPTGKWVKRKGFDRCIIESNTSMDVQVRFLRSDPIALKTRGT